MPSSNGIYSIMKKPLILIWAGTAVGLAGEIGIGKRIHSNKSSMNQNK